MDVFEGKSIFIWNTPSIFDGNPQKIAALLRTGGFKTAIFKAAQGDFVFVPPIFPFARWMRKPNVSADLVKALHDVDIKVAGFGFCFGTDPEGEGTIAAQLVDSLDLDGWVWDVEDSFEIFINNDPNPGFERAKRLIGSYVENRTTTVPTTFCSWARWRDPRQNLDRPWHNVQMAGLFMAFCDYGMPMCYWSRFGYDGKPVKALPADATGLLAETIKQWAPVTDKPLIPVGRAYTGNGGFANGAVATAFDAYARANNLRGVSWWGLDWAKNIPEVWAALTRMPSVYHVELAAVPPATVGSGTGTPQAPAS